MKTCCLKRDVTTMVQMVGALIAITLRYNIVVNMQGREHQYW